MKDDYKFLMREEIRDTIKREIGERLTPVLAGVEHIQEALRAIGPASSYGQEIEEIKQKVNLTPEEVERVYGLNAATLANKRTKGAGPRYIKDGGKVLYPQKEIQKYLNAREILTNGDS